MGAGKPVGRLMQIDLLDWTQPHRGPVPWQGARPRQWQADALPAALECIDAGQFGLVSAVMGAGKSIFLAELLRLRPPPTGAVNVVTTPTVKLVEQLADTIEARLGTPVGRYYTHGKTVCDVTVTCQPSAAALAERIAADGKRVHLWICDEAHKSQSNQMLSVADAFKPVAAIGCTATPFRATRHEDLSLWPVMLHEYSAAQAFADGVVVPPELVQWDGPETPLDDVCVALIRRVLHHGPGLANAENIDDAQDFADRLNGEGISAGVVHSRMPRAEVTAAIAALRTGETQALVHVNMLSEGVDLPWLRWLCMRRKVGSSVRFCQEVGRVLRSAPGLKPPKTVAYLLDPHDLFDSFGLTYEAMLAGSATKREELAEDAELTDLADDLLADEKDGPVLDLGPDERTAARISKWRRYVRRLYLAMIIAGVCEEKIKSTGWRKFPPSPAQLKNVGFALGGTLRDTAVPLSHRKALRLISEHVGDLQKGDVSDLMSIGFKLKDRRSAGMGWPDLRGADAPEVEE